MGVFERFLTIWVAAAIVAGVGLGLAAPGVFEAVADLEIAQVNLVVAVLIWLMIYPMMLRVEPSCLADVGRKPKGLALTLTVNWLIKPFTMAALAILFFRYVYAEWVPAGQAEEYIAGMILLGVAPCTAMVFVWSQLTNGNANYTLAQVSINDLILVFAFAPIAGLLLGVTDLTVPWGTLVASVIIFVVVPLTAGLLTRSSLLKRGGPGAVERFATRWRPTSIIGLLLTVVLLFGFQAETSPSSAPMSPNVAELCDCALSQIRRVGHGPHGVTLIQRFEDGAVPLADSSDDQRRGTGHGA